MRWRRGDMTRELETTVEPLPGRDGWLFLTGDTNDVIAQHTGAVRPTRKWARQWRRVLRRRAGAMRRLGVRWVYLIAPDKEAAYADKLPDEIVPAPRRPVHELIEIAERAGVDLVYPLEQMRAGRDRGPVYYQTDTHWTTLGSFIAYREVCARLRARGLELPVLEPGEIDWQEIRHAGDLGSKLDPPLEGAAQRAWVREPRSRIVADNLVAVTGRRIKFESDARGVPDAILFGSSYAFLALLFFKESFRHLTFVHTTGIDLNLVRHERPDAVISMTSERGLMRVPDDRNAGRDLAAIEERKRAARIVPDPAEVERIGLA